MYWVVDDYENEEYRTFEVFRVIDEDDERWYVDLYINWNEDNFDKGEIKLLDQKSIDKAYDHPIIPATNEHLRYAIETIFVLTE